MKLGATALMTYVYGEKDGNLLRQQYANGHTVSYTYDLLGRVKTATCADGRVLTYTYTGEGQVYTVHDSRTGYTYRYIYDNSGGK